MTTTTLLGTALTLPPTLLTAIRLLPLLSSTASLTHAYMENLTTSAFLRAPPTTSQLTRTMAKTTPTAAQPTKTAEIEAAKDIVIPIWFVNFFHGGIWSVIGFNTLTTTSALANLFVLPGVDRLGSNRRFYVVGLAAALAHYAFVPAVAGSVERLFKMCVEQANGEEGRGTAAKNVEEWVGVHRIRMTTVDLCAWVCFIVGAVGVQRHDMGRASSAVSK